MKKDKGDVPAYMQQNSIFDLSSEERQELGAYLLGQIDYYLSHTDEVDVSPELNLDSIVQHARKFSFDHPIPAREAIDHTMEGLMQYQVHTPHPRYFGLFNPRPNFMGIIADMITAAYNPQLAAWSHAPIAVEIENYVWKEFASKFGFHDEHSDGTFTTGGAEANLTALLTALMHHFPEYARKGLIGINRKPILYASAESHHSLVKAARSCGLGTDSIHLIQTNASLQMDTKILEKQIEEDRSNGLYPFMVVATGGTTGAGAIDPIHDIADLANREKLWLHVDAAYGGAALFDPGLFERLHGIHRADSITFDAHKWLSVPMGAGIYLTRHKDILNKTFSITADYMPKEGGELETNDPYTHSIQWSRRFIGLKVYLSLLTAGWEGYRKMIQHQVAMGNLLRKELIKSNWTIMNDTVFPVVCFTDSNGHVSSDPDFVPYIGNQIVRSGQAWISIYGMNKTQTLRACITNYDTTEQDVMVLVELLNRARNEFLENKQTNASVALVEKSE